MAREERDKYFAKYGKSSLGFVSPKAIYDSIKKELGVKDVTEAKDEDILYGLAGRYLPRLSLGLGKSRATGGTVGNVADDDVTKTIRVFVGLDSIQNAISKLVGKSTRGRAIVSVRIPKRRVYI